MAYGYTPSLAMSVIFMVLFSLTSVVHEIQAYLWIGHRWMCVMTVGALREWLFLHAVAESNAHSPFLQSQWRSLAGASDFGATLTSKVQATRLRLLSLSSPQRSSALPSVSRTSRRSTAARKPSLIRALASRHAPRNLGEYSRHWHARNLTDSSVADRHAEPRWLVSLRQVVRLPPSVCEDQG